MVGEVIETPAVAPATPAAPVTPVANIPWSEGVDTDTAGYLQNRGWDKLSAKDAALAAAKAHREAEKLIGAPPEHVVRIPQAANDAEGWNKVYGRLGVPTDAKEYDFGGVKHANGNALDEASVASLRTLGGEQHLTKDQAKAVAYFIAKQDDARAEIETATYNEKLTAEKATLKTSWGSNATNNLIVAQNAATKLGVTAEELSALEKTVGYARVMEMFRNVGSRIGEDQFIRDNGGGNGGAVTKEAAQSRLDMLATDQQWQDNFNKGGVKERQEFDNLTRLIAG
jgi:hypothetical protein